MARREEWDYFHELPDEDYPAPDITDIESPCFVPGGDPIFYLLWTGQLKHLKGGRMTARVLDPRDREISALRKELARVRAKNRAMQEGNATRTPAPGGAVQVLLVQVVCTNDSRVFLVQNQEGTIWGDSPAYPDQNGDRCLMRVFPHSEFPGFWQSQEVTLWGMDNLMEMMEMIPPDTRWFIPV